jgi:serine/threonine protein kinase
VTRRIRAASHDTMRDSNGVAVAAARRLASQIMSRWQQGEPANAKMAFQGHPELQQYRSIAMNLVYEDYCQRVEQGEQIDPDTFASEFPELQTAIRRQIEVHDYLAKFPDISSPDAPPAWPSLGDRFLGFDLHEELGRGAIARVYLATEWAVGDRYVAVKVSQGGAAEAHILGRLDHPNIVPILSVTEEEASGLSAVCMPYRGRLTIAELLDALYEGGKKPVNARDLNDTFVRLSQQDVIPCRSIPGCRNGLYVDAVLSLVAQLADALAYTHDQDMLHRDLKPSNILLSTDGVPMLLDFNLSLDKRKTISRIGGTLPYMSPEQIRQAMYFPPPGARNGEDEEPIDGRSDLFALGVIAYELLTGIQPFADFAAAPFAKDAAQDLLARQASGVTPASQLNKQVDRQISDLVAACMAYDVAARPPSASDLSMQINRLLQWRSRASRWVRWHPVRTAAGGLLISAAIAAGPIWYLTAPTNWQVAVRLLEEGDARAAANRFQLEIDNNPKSAVAWFALGRAQLQSEPRAVNARRCFQEAFELSKDPRLLSAVAYCDGLNEASVPAAEYFKQAIEKGDKHAVIHYNRALALRKSSSYAYHLAINECTEALRLDARLTAARHLRGSLQYATVVNDRSGKIEPREYLLAAVTDLQIAATELPEYAQYHYDLARAAARLSLLEESYKATVVDALQHAVERGWPSSKLVDDPRIANCLTEAQLQSILDHSDANREPLTPPAYLLPPLLESNLPDSADAEWQRVSAGD